jgi:hypothetical protein
MRWTALVALVLITGRPANAEPKDPYDAFSYEVVVPTPKESALRLKKDVVFARGDRGPLKLDVYLPRTGVPPPAVVFANVVGERGSRPFRAAEIYRSWARLLAANGIAGVIMDSETAHAARGGARARRAPQELVVTPRSLRATSPPPGPRSARQASRGHPSRA